MPEYRMMRFANPELLKSLDRGDLIAFLSEYREYFVSRGVKIPQPGRDGRLNYDKLFRVLVTPTEKTPRDLLDALYLIDEMSTDLRKHALMDACASGTDNYSKESIALTLPDKATPADVALGVWLFDRDILERLHAEWTVPELTRFAYFRSSVSLEDRDLSVDAFEADLNDWFVERLCGNGTKVWDLGGDPDKWYLVRHGRPYKRLETWNGKTVTQIEYQPLTYDAILFNRENRTLKINACCPEERELYREMFGKHAFQNEGLFADSQIFTLQPLKHHGEKALGCGCVPGIESIRATELQLGFEDAYGRVEVWKSDDIFGHIGELEEDAKVAADLKEAEFQVNFNECLNPRSFRLRLPNMAEFSRKDDMPQIEQWLQEREFLLEKEEP